MPAWFVTLGDAALVVDELVPVALVRLRRDEETLLADVTLGMLVEATPICRASSPSLRSVTMSLISRICFASRARMLPTMKPVLDAAPPDAREAFSALKPLGKGRPPVREGRLLKREIEELELVEELELEELDSVEELDSIEVIESVVEKELAAAAAPPRLFD